jgi:hypothetical protein
MQLILKRKYFYPDGIVGELFLDGAFECYTLEDPEREVKIPHITCIPAGIYPVQKYLSPRWKRNVPLLVGVPNFTAVEIHIGNFPRDTDGCILVGSVRDPKQAAIYSSKAAFELLMERLEVGFLSNCLTITIIDEVKEEKREAA